MAKKKTAKKRTATAAAPVASYKHDAKRVRIPTQEESEKLTVRQKQPVKKKYAYDPSLDPQLVWAGKQEAGDKFSVPTVPIYVQEKIAPEALIARLKLGNGDVGDTQLLLFGETAQTQVAKAVEFYDHEDNWQNRMILGDSLLVMNSLLEKERMRGKVQSIYLDPPYGIKFASNWQVSTTTRGVKDKLEDFIRQPEQVKAFRDTWELGVHSYPSYLRDRFLVARELLAESGSCFVQISDENVHHVREVLDEVFGAINFVSQITVQKTGGQTPILLPRVADYILWYAKDVKSVKYRQLFTEKADSSLMSQYQYIEDRATGEIKRLTKRQIEGSEEIPDKWRVFRYAPMNSQHFNEERSQPYIFNGKSYFPGADRQWAVSHDGIKKLEAKKRLITGGSSLYYKLYLDDMPMMAIRSIWSDTSRGSFTEEKIYVVQTTTKIVQRCMLMTSDPGDIILDPTCGSGTTAYVAEQWGRRWITIDTSRVALALARTRLMTSKFPFYKLKEEKRVSIGFEYKSVPHVTLKSLANDEEPEHKLLYDQPEEIKNVVRVSGPFTVESLSPHRVSDRQELLSTERFVETVIDNMRRAGVQTGEKSSRLELLNLDILPSSPAVQAMGESKEGLKIAVSVGPEFGSVDDDFIREAVVVAGKFANLLVVAATSFDASAFAEPSQINGLQVMKVKINPDLSMGDLLKKTGSGNLFLAFGEPQVGITESKDGLRVEIQGVDVYDPVKSEIRSSGSGDPEHDIAAWFIDTNYNGEAFFVMHAYFLGADKPYEKLKRALKAEINEEAWEELYSTVSRPFPKPKTGKIAVKVINHYGDEVMKVLDVK